MNRRELKRLDSELHEFLQAMFAGMGRRERRESMSAYVLGLLLDGERKSIEPMARRLVDDGAEAQGMRQRLQECVAVSSWSEAELWSRLGAYVDRELPGLEALVIDDTGFPKKGTHSVGVQRQYSGTLGRIDNCQVAVSLHVAGEGTSACIGMNLFLPESWAGDAKRRKKAGVPDELECREKWRIALSQLDAALAAGVGKHVVLADPGYGDIGEFRAGLRERGLAYIVGVTGTAMIWRPESHPQLPSTNGPGRPPTRYRDEKHPPVAMSELAKSLRYREVKWRQGSQGWQSSRFAAVRVRTARQHGRGEPPGQPQWLLTQWPDGAEAPTKYWLADLPEDASMRTLVRLAKLRWRVERDYQEMKQEIGLDHFEGRTWRGFHHHVALCAIAHAFLALQRALSPPQPKSMDVA